MASIARTTTHQRTLASDTLERVLAAAAVALLITVLVALAKGHAQWSAIPLVIWGHLATIMVALALTPVMLLRRRGDAYHRQLGWIWVASMLLTALVSFGIRESNRGGFSIVHILSVWTLIQVPLIVWSARTHNVVRHRRAVRGMVVGALLIAGFFTFPFNRLLGHWLFS